jgi:hypothetical protein
VHVEAAILQGLGGPVLYWDVLEFPITQPPGILIFRHRDAYASRQTRQGIDVVLSDRSCGDVEKFPAE